MLDVGGGLWMGDELGVELEGKICVFRVFICI